MRRSIMSLALALMALVAAAPVIADVRVIVRPVFEPGEGNYRWVITTHTDGSGEQVVNPGRAIKFMRDELADGNTVVHIRELPGGGLTETHIEPPADGEPVRIQSFGTFVVKAKSPQVGRR